MAAYNPKAGFTLQKPRLPDSTFGTHASSELYWQSQYMLPVPLLVTAHQGPCSKARLSETLKQSAAAVTATASTNRIVPFIGITRNDLRCAISDWRRPALDLLHVCALPCAPQWSCPLYLRKQTCAVHLGMSALGHVWTAPGWQELSSRCSHWSVRPCVRPVSAVLMTAGHNALRGSGPNQKRAFH